MTEQEWLDIFGDNLASILHERKMTQKELAYEADLSESVVSDYINKRKIPGLKAIINMSYALHCDLEEFIDFGYMIK